jgi:6-phosphogluconolactonase (cycloisomerase 2 family)
LQVSRHPSFARPLATAALLGLAALTAALVLAGSAQARDSLNGAVFTQSNDPSGNDLLVFRHGHGGDIESVDSVATGGAGTGSGLGNQGAVVVDERARLVFLVNAGSDEISSFRIGRSGVELVDTVDSGGAQPISITVRKGLLYVLNAGRDVEPGGIAGFRYDRWGALTAIPGSVRPLSAAAVGPAQIQFDPRGQVLAVTEKATDQIVTYVVGSDGLATGPQVFASSGDTPFGFSFDRRGNLIVSEAFGSAGGTESAVSSYAVGADGTLSVISPSVAAPGQVAACWIVISRNGRFAYTTNTATNSVSLYSIGADGSLTLEQAVSAASGPGPVDAAISRDGRVLFVLTGDGIESFRIGAHGHLTAADEAPVSGANGLATF